MYIRYQCLSSAVTYLDFVINVQSGILYVIKLGIIFIYIGLFEHFVSLFVMALSIYM